MKAIGNGLSNVDQAAISVENVSKSFVLRRNRTRSLRERLSFGKPSGMALSEEFWALHDVSFQVQPGQSVGIVGHNGSGKSTMLKILTGIMKPTVGTVRVRGRIGALIEVGAGFHPDLSGRENIFLNGSILGLSRREVAKKFDEIVAFAGLERFVDTPVKRYSSGMYMRLGFSIAVHTDPDVLLIDEVLAVGDTLFQRKCLRRLEQFVADGGAAIFVSHGMAQVADLCKTCVWLDHGQARFIGATEEAIDHYMAVVAERQDVEFKREHPEEWAALMAVRSAEREANLLQLENEERERIEAEREEADRILAQQSAQEAARLADPTRGRILGVTLRDARGIVSRHVAAGERVRLEIAYEFRRFLPDPIFGIDFIREDGLHMFTTSTFDHQVSLRHLPERGTLTLDVAALALNKGKYRMRVTLFAQSATENWWDDPEDEIANAVEFEVDAGRFGIGCAYLPAQWCLPNGTNGEPARVDIDLALAGAVEPRFSLSPFSGFDSTEVGAAVVSEGHL